MGTRRELFLHDDLHATEAIITTMRVLNDVSKSEYHRHIEMRLLAFQSARVGNVELLGTLVGQGIPVNLADCNGNSLLMLASLNGHTACVRSLLNLGAEVDFRNQRGQTPLGAAAFKGYSAIIKLLWKHGAALDADNGKGMTPIVLAKVFGRHAAVQVLEDLGADSSRCKQTRLSARYMNDVASVLGKLF